ncbi:short-chain dehydrogenase [Devosia limi DSM 17137]|uniref:NAD(P)-dependent dehydrogenase, short-chain alcohol dehydrogenase family n=1 Tax=Devosia limi DSM 17137 TaxID=1121477 RepID=A0A0F5LQI7_9HYPH|nr:SDR family oxidoreductase [Devosia limi]KKB84409.1 short-chain dehydrogenase [Devosia limi DSM 17137]SHF61080.1 NAD(P)-dependent dehydrogenase, short-chain alcohol dehydrogenase family [Devosia limi DSM 17137]
MLLNGKTAVVTGAGNPEGIGFAAAEAFISQGARVLLVDINEEQLVDASTSLGEMASYICADVRSEDSVRKVFSHASQHFGSLDILLNNAGITQPRKTVDITREDYDAIMDVNLRGTLIVTQQALALMTSGASIICIASIAAQRGGGLMGGPHYAASKGGVSSLVKAIARDVSPSGIRINSINPGVIMSRMTKDFYTQQITDRVLPTIPLGRFGQPSDVASACVFLASDMSSYITGSSIDVNGGMHMN